MQPQAQPTGSAPRPFRVDVPQATIDRILNRVRDTQWPDRLDATDWRYGANWDYVRALAQYWVERFDWRKAEKNLNRYPQFLARVGDYDIHFYHVKGRGSPKPMPLILTHGWPGSVLEFIEAIGPLSDPASFGGSPRMPSTWWYLRCQATAFPQSRRANRSGPQQLPPSGIN